MSDIVRRLRFAFDSGVPLLRLSQDGVRAERDPLCKEAADEIERLSAEVAHWKEARSMAISAGDMIKEENDRLRAEVAALNQPVKLSEWQELVAERDRLQSLLETANAYGAAENKARIEERELLAQMMIRQSLSTGHGDTVADLVRELEPQIERLRADAERYRWLEERPTATGLARWMGRHQFLSTAIDAARKESE